MSIAREALRLSVVRALRGCTWAGDAVRDSEIGPLEDWAADQPRPTIIVYTDDSKFGGDAQSGLFAGGVQTLLIEVVMTQKMKVRLEEAGEDAWQWDVPQTDAAMEITLGAIERQIKTALSDPGNAWAELFRDLALDVGECVSNRGSSMRDGVRFAGRQMIIPVTLPSDPAPGRAPGPLWQRFLTLVDADEDLAQVAPLLRSLIEWAPGVLPDWQTLASGYGMSAGVARAIGIAPPVAVDDEDPTIAVTAQPDAEANP